MPGCGDQLYWPGHNLHWIQTKKAGSDPLAWFPATVINLAGDIATVRYDDDASTCRLWRHGGYTLRLRVGDRVSVCALARPAAAGRRRRNVGLHRCSRRGTETDHRAAGGQTATVPRRPGRHEHRRGTPVTNLFQTYFPGEWRVPDNQGNPWLVRRSGSHGSLRGGSGTVRPVFDSTRSRNQLIHPLRSTSSPCPP
jgi:hypothetical protein